MSTEWTPKPGWLARQMDQNAIEIATWPASLRREAGFTDEGLTDRQRDAAIVILRARIDELEQGRELV